MHPRNRVCQGVTVNLVRQRPTLRRTTPPTPRVPVYAGAFFIPGGTRRATLEMKGPNEWGRGVFNRTPEHIAAFRELSDFLTAEVAKRRANPTDDLITHLAEAEIDGDRLSEREVVLNDGNLRHGRR